MSLGIDHDERLFKNLHPMDYDNGRISSTAFNPSSSHSFKLSVDRGALSSAKESFERHLGNGLVSIGVCGVLAHDFAYLSITCICDPILGNSAHALADFGPFAKGDRKRKARLLANLANEYGWDYTP